VIKLPFVAQFIFLNFWLFVILQSVQRLSFTTKMADSSHFVSAHLTSNKFKNRLVNVLPCEWVWESSDFVSLFVFSTSLLKATDTLIHSSNDRRGRCCSPIFEADSPQVTLVVNPLPLLSVRPAVTFPASERHRLWSVPMCFSYHAHWCIFLFKNAFSALTVFGFCVGQYIGLSS